MLNIQQIVKETLQAYEKVSDEKRRKWEEGYFPSALKILGVKTPDARKIIADLRSKITGEPPETIVALAKALAETQVMPCLHSAYVILSENPQARAILSMDDLKVLTKIFDNWATVDVFCIYVSGPAWREGFISDETIHQWARSEDRWWRRAAVVSTVALNKKEYRVKGEVERTLKVCRTLVTDRDDKVVKALSWALRELAMRDEEPVKAFMQEYEESLPALVKREVWRKINTGRKN